MHELLTVHDFLLSNNIKTLKYSENCQVNSFIGLIWAPEALAFFFKKKKVKIS